MKLYKDNNNNIYAYEANDITNNLIDGKVEITQEEANVIYTQISQTRLNSLTYAQKRAAEYPPYTDYLDGIVKGDNAQVQAYIDACNAVKNKYPKGAA